MKHLSPILYRLFSRENKTLEKISDYEKRVDKMSYYALLKETGITELTARMNNISKVELQCMALQNFYNRVNMTRFDNQLKMMQKTNELKQELKACEDYMFNYYMHQN